MIPAVNSFLIACLSETLGYGIALVLFILSMMTLLKKKKASQNLNYPLFIAAPILFFLCTLHIFGVWVRTYKAFVDYPEGPIAYFALITSPEKTVTQVGQVGGVILADLMTLYRALVIWKFNYYVVILPTLTFIATVVCAAGFITTQHRVNVHTSIFSTTVTKWTESFLGASLVTTGICTILICYKLLSISKNLGQTAAFDETRSLTSRVLRIFVESAMLYSINNFFYALLYSLKVNPESWFSGLDAAVASITFSLIIIRVEGVVNRPPTMIPLSYSTGSNTKATHRSSSSSTDGSPLPGQSWNNRDTTTDGSIPPPMIPSKGTFFPALVNGKAEYSEGPYRPRVTIPSRQPPTGGEGMGYGGNGHVADAFARQG